MRTITINTNGLGVQDFYPIAMIEISEGSEVLKRVFVSFDEVAQSEEFTIEDGGAILFKISNITSVGYWFTYNSVLIAPGYASQNGFFNPDNTIGITLDLTSVSSNQVLPERKVAGVLDEQTNTLDLIYQLNGESIDTTGTSPTSIPNLSNFPMLGGWILPNPYFVKKKSCSPEIQNVELCGFAENSGIGQYVNIISSNDLLFVPETPPANDSLPNELLVTAEGSFLYKPNKKFTRFQTLTDSRMADFTSEGSVGNLKGRGQFKFKIENSTAALGALKKMSNQRLIFVYQNSSGQKVIMGNLIFPAQIAAYNQVLNDNEAYIEITVQNGIKFPMYWKGEL